MQLLTADWIHHRDTFRRDHALLLGDDGQIVAAGPAAEVAARQDAQGAAARHFAGRALSPGTISAHSHCFQVFLRGAGDHPRGFADWVTRFLYPLVERLDDEALEAAALLCFTTMARAGITTVGEFHYVHNDMGAGSRGNDLANLVLRAARRVGLRVGFLRTIYDVSKRPGQSRFAQSPGQAEADIRILAAQHAHDPAVTVMPAPHSLHGATRGAIEMGARLAAELETRWHIHLAEQQDDVAFAQAQHGATPLQVLEDWGVLDARTVLVHGIWLSPEERALLAERDGGLVSNPTTNMALGDGIAALDDLLRRGVPVGLGTDMNAKPNVFDEMRTAEYLQRVKSLEMGILPRVAGGEPDPAQIFELGTRHGAAVLGLATGALEPGRWADLLVIDLDDPSLLPGSVLGGDALLNLLSSGMVPETALREVWVAGAPIVLDGEPVHLPLAELAAKVRAVKALQLDPTT